MSTPSIADLNEKLGDHQRAGDALANDIALWKKKCGEYRKALEESSVRLLEIRRCLCAATDRSWRNQMYNFIDNTITEIKRVLK